MTLSPPEWVLRQLSPNFFSLKIGAEETWVHFLPFSGRRQLVDAAVYRHLCGTKIPLPRQELLGETCLNLPTQRLAIFHPPLYGSAVDFRDPEDRRWVAEFLAEFHRATEGFVPEVRPHSTLGGLAGHWERRLERLYEFKRLARYRVYPGIMDHLFLEHADMIEEAIRAGLAALQKADYQSQCHEYGQICYFHFQSKFFWRSEAGVSLWHFAYCHWDLPVFDLYRYIMEVGRRNFISDEAYGLIVDYERIRPLREYEINLLNAFFLFPERLYRLFSAFYLNRTSKAPRRLINRIEREMRARAERTKIIQKIGDVGEH